MPVITRLASFSRKSAPAATKPNSSARYQARLKSEAEISSAGMPARFSKRSSMIPTGFSISSPAASARPLARTVMGSESLASAVKVAMAMAPWPW